VEVAVVPTWRTSTYSGQNGNCVEVARNTPGVVAVRDSKDRGGAVLAFGAEAWREFTGRVTYSSQSGNCVEVAVLPA
jgi:hypothetical protein